MAVIGCVLLLAGCTARPELTKSGEAVAREAPPAEEQGEFRVQRIYYGTDRKETAVATPAEYYGGERGGMSLGVAEAHVPPERLIDPQAWQFLKVEAFATRLKRVELAKVEPLPRGDFFARLQLDVQASPRNDVFVFIHGYNVPFEKAARRTAQIAHDMGFDGVAVLFSWPSQAAFMDYTVDETNVEWAMPHLKEFLSEISAQAGAEHLHLIAHSMGTRALAGSLRELAAERAGERMFDQVVLAAPDIDADVFRRDVVPRILKVASRITLYASSGDEALSVSRKVHGYLRGGETGEELIIMPGVDTIDATDVSGHVLGHSYYGDSRQVIMDLRRLLIGAESISERDLLPKERADGTYWTFPEE